MEGSGSKPSSVSRLLLAGLTIVASSGLTWVVKDALDRPRLAVEILGVDVTKQSIPVRLQNIMAATEFLEEHGGEITSVLRSLPSGMGDLKLDQVKSPDAIAGLMDAMAKLDSTVPISRERVDSALKTGRAVLLKARQAESELATFLFANPRPSTTALPQYRALFGKFDRDEELTGYMPFSPDPDATAETWHRVLTESKTRLALAVEVSGRGLDGLEEDVTKASSALSPGVLRVRAVVGNAGNTAGSIWPNGVLIVNGAENDVIDVETDATLERLLVRAREQIIVEFHLDVRRLKDPRIWEALNARYSAGSENCRIRLATLDDRIISSREHPFGTREAHALRLQRQLHQ